jgi:hypothetical protein
MRISYVVSADAADTILKDEENKPSLFHSCCQKAAAAPLPNQMILFPSNVNHTFFYAKDAVPKDEQGSLGNNTMRISYVVSA